MCMLSWFISTSPLKEYCGGKRNLQRNNF
ncbi:hypothetical protein WN66_04332 [Saccharomyces cerevisiae]|uniref:Putative uncharacterized protein YLR149C-A n=2 Tax=Saccharomyces cerevisiae TaxID=4932 RepID=YL49A_YEAST|nr:RecName: Full=Putative uncharacterized protein YLR149C-A [Saccharomyces cerevisiae S288C]KZV09395.1 hypothetical protein WN66_04332 [Saccharomyces cerevisiae]WNV72846.1 hypothetical protein O6U65_1706 [Saccharomyces cerevisiae synthetic construct]CAY81386.1 EC1118_1L10_2377p [Saccharomyces cerevisiae EC1118]